jgi:hypothetical protein
VYSIDHGLRSFRSFNKGDLMENIVLMNSGIFVSTVVPLLGWTSAVLEGFILRFLNALKITYFFALKETSLTH